MLRELWETYQKGRDFDELEALAADLVAENDRLRLENAKLRSENRMLRHKLHDREFKTLRRAQVDASMLGLLALAGLPASRSACAEYGISKRRWMWARALLRVAHVLDDDGWMVDDATGFDERLAAGVRVVESVGMERVRRCLPHNGRAEWASTRPARRSTPSRSPSRN